MSSFACARFSTSFVLLLSIGCSGIAAGNGDDADGAALGSDPTKSVDSTVPAGGSGGPAETLDGMFRAPVSTAVTQDSIYGLWAGSANGADVRVRFTEASIKIAKRCWTDDRASGAEVAARVSRGSIQVLESKRDVHANSVTRSYCNVDIHPLTIPACTTTDRACFSVRGTTLDISDAALFLGQTGSAGDGGPDRRFIKLTD